MLTLQPTLKRGRDVWDPIHLPPQEFEGRLQRIRNEMRNRGIDLLFLYGHGMNEYGNPSYVSNVVNKMPRGALVICPRQGEPVLIVEGFPRDLPEAKSTTWIGDVRSCGDISKECVRYLREKGFLSSTIGLAGINPFMPYDQFRSMRAALKGCRLVDCEQMVRDLRAVKSERECDQIRRASRIVRKGLESLTEMPLQKTSERELEAILDLAARLEGAEDVRIMVANPRQPAWAFRPTENFMPSEAGAIIVSMAVAFERYWAEAIRTYRVDSSSLLYYSGNSIGAVYEKMLGGMRPENGIDHFCRHAHNEIEESRLYSLPVYGLGNGIGLALQEYPLLEGGENAVLKKAMCFAVRLAAKDPEIGSVMIGDTIILSEGGVEVTTR